VGGENVSRNVSQDVSRMSLEEIENIIKDMIKTITRYIKEIPKIKYVGKGKNGHWELND